MTGGDVLQETGSWAPAPEYGEVWYPPVQAGWVPYREGQWAYVAPWGWTWVDNASWGFAPFHYGRWVQVGPRWGWIPVAPGIAVGPGAGYGRPVYSPALVSFVGLGASVAVGAAIGASIGASVGWIPLGPREAYYPPYHVSETYLRRAERDQRAQCHRDPRRHEEQRGHRTTSSIVAARQWCRRWRWRRPCPSRERAQPMTPEMLAAVRPMQAVPVRPTAETIGVTPAVARQFNIARSAVRLADGR